MSVSLTIPSQSAHSYALALIHCLLLVAETLLSPNEAFDAESLFPPKHIASIPFHPIQWCATALSIWPCLVQWFLSCCLCQPLMLSMRIFANTHIFHLKKLISTSRCENIVCVPKSNGKSSSSVITLEWYGCLSACVCVCFESFPTRLQMLFDISNSLSIWWRSFVIENESIGFKCLLQTHW